jgi:hypothetical protein
MSYIFWLFNMYKINTFQSSIVSIYSYEHLLHLLTHVNAWTCLVYLVVLSINFLFRGGESVFVF